MASSRFEALARSTMDEILSWTPATATHVGWHRYDALLPDPSEASYRHQLERMRELLEQFRSFPRGELSQDETLDADLAVRLLEIRRFELGQLRIHEHESQVASEIGNALFHLFSKDFAPFEARVEPIVSRMEAVPEFVEKSRAILKDPYRLWNEVALESGERLPPFLDSILRTSETKLTDGGPLRRLRAATRRAIEEIAEYSEWLISDVMSEAGDRYAVPFDKYLEYMRVRRIRVTADEAVAIAERHLEAAKQRRAQIAHEIAPWGDASRAIDIVRAASPAAFEEVLRRYRAAVADSREFLVRHELVTFPEGERLLVIETPHFMRHVAPFAAEYEPGKFDDNQTGLFLVTPVDDDVEMLKDHNYAAISNTAVHEGYPGHHLQGVCANANPSHIRVLSAAPDFGEGWGLYSEELMVDSGFHTGAPERLVQVNDLIYRIVRVIADVKLASGEMTPHDVAGMLVRETGVNPTSAMNEARSYCMAPTYYLSYFIGKLEVLQLRRDVERAMGEEFSLRFFHDAMLYAGTLPMDFMRRAVDIRMRMMHGVALDSKQEPLGEFAAALASAGRS